MQYSRFLSALVAVAALPAAEFSTYIGDENTWNLTSLVVDASGNTYVAGSRTFDLSYEPLRPQLRSEAIVAKLDGNGKTVAFAGIGGKGNEVANAVAVDRNGNIYIGGSTTSPNFPARNALYPNLTPATPGFFGTLGFIAKFNPDASQVVYSTYFPSPVLSIVVDGEGAVYVGGTTYLSTFPTTPGLPNARASTGFPLLSGAFLTKIAPSGNRIVYSTVVSGTNKPCGAGSTCFTSSRGATGVAVAADASGNGYLAGNSDVTDLPTTAGVLTPAGSGAFVMKVNAAGSAVAYLTYVGTAGRTLAPFFTPGNRLQGLAVDSAGNAFVAGTTWDPNLPFANRLSGDVEDAFAMKLNPSGTAVVWGRYLGGDAVDYASAASLGADGNFWVAGTAHSTAFPNVDGWSTGESYVVRLDGRGELTYSGRYPSGSVGAIAGGTLLHVVSPGGVAHAMAASPRPAVTPWSVGPKGGQVAPGMVVEIFGPHIGGPGAQVFFNDIPAPILYAGDEQVNTIVPFALAGKETARIRIGSGPEFIAAVVPAMPRIYALVNQDGTVNGPENPAAPGSIMTAWVSGSGYEEHLGILQTPEGRLVAKVYEGGYQINFVAPPPDVTVLVLTSGRYASTPFPITLR